MRGRGRFLQQKKRLLAVGLVLFAIWPLVQHVLVMRYDVNPWKLAGWAMYCLPTPKPRLWIHTLGPQATEISWETESPELRDAVGRFGQRLWVFGGLAGTPARVAEMVLADRPEVAGIEVTATRLVFEPTTAVFRTQTRTWTFARDAAD